MSSQTNPIQTRELRRHYGKTEAVTSLDLNVPAGAIYALVGANGAGKTTAIQCLMNIQRANSGTATVLGTDSRRLGPKELARIGYVSENQELPGWMTVQYFLDYLAPFYPTWNRDRANELVRQLELPRDRKLRQLSRGMKMKAALASSLAYSPELIVMDEPFSGLDPLVRDELIEALLEASAQATVLISSHDLAEIETFASHVGYLESGRLRFSEELSSLAARFRDVQVRCEGTASLPAQLPEGWLNPRAEGSLVRFIASGFDPERTPVEARRAIAGAREVTAEAMPLRAIVVALAKARRA